ncbi:HD domain-containing phosphohydrolase [Larsenimonas suaedae]|uniref:PilZ domain-containing protein n=1 Tax=Larsenimonas suaedae TaxID=1851019 RepID=A0ABU1GX36_9GAMM|nr:HD domain-containing phosphohydrolase [Larsenimonas suaedae]MCM2973122.1 PilZ domain-containing protein [Larsenimonas suaedae]MDR5896559.1 PilZ domain-containing protein [Larsenimonas suaedae]
MESGRLILIAESAQQVVRFSGLCIQRTRHVEDGRVLETGLPEALNTDSKRQSARIPLTSGMKVPLELMCLEGQAAIRGRLGDISNGGCMMELPLSRCDPLRVGMTVSLSMVFPSEERFEGAAEIRYIRPLAASHHARVGLAFLNLAQAQVQQLMHILSETEREVAWRNGEAMQFAGASALYVSTAARKGQRRTRGRPVEVRSPMVDDLRDIVRTQHLYLLALQQKTPLPERALAKSADRLIQLLKHNRQQVFYALGCLSDEPQWVQHSLCVSCRLCDLMLAEPEHASRARSAMLAALVHDMGKAMMIGPEFPTLDGEFEADRRHRFRQHVPVLLEALKTTAQIEKAMCLEIIQGINERLDGSGYPDGLEAEALTPLSKMAAVIDVIDAMMRPRGDRRASTAMEAYRFVYQRPEQFERHWVTRYVQRHGFYPIGSLVRFSRGYLAWVMRLDQSGQPTRVRVVRDLRQQDVVLNLVLERVDFAQLGELESLVSPEPYKLTAY